MSNTLHLIRNSAENNLDTERTRRSVPNISSSKLNCLNRQIDRKRLRKYFFKQNDDGDTHLHLTIILNNVQASLWLISQAPDPSYLNIFNDDLQSPLHLAVMVHKPWIVRRLIVAGANFELRTKNGDTALHLACASNDLSCVRALIEPLNFFEEAWLMSNNDVQTLPNLSQNLELRNYKGKTCLHIAVSEGHFDIISELIRSGANPETQEGLAGMTALHMAVEKGDRRLVSFLVNECSASPRSTTYAGTTPCQLALDFNRFEIAEDLLRFGGSLLLAGNEICSDSDIDSSSKSQSDDSSA